MSDTFVKNYLSQVTEKFDTDQAREHAYRPALNSLFEKISGLTVVNDPKRSQHGAPDFVFLKSKATIAYAEAKDITVGLNETAKSEQLERYYGYSNLILTNCLEFRFYRNGQPYTEPISIAEIRANKIIPNESNFAPLEDTLKDFLEQAREPITSGTVLSKVMAGKARRIRDNIQSFLKFSDDPRNESLLSIFRVIKDLLLADLDYPKFADMYAQTLVYGLFVARFYDKTEDIFTRQKARDLVPASNPFLRHFFDHIAGASFDSRLEYIVNELCEEFTHTDVRAIVHNYYKTDKDPSRDPIIHFYEDFLKEYNPKERLELGVFYTPLPVVDFIVRSLDEILKKDFNLQGLADSSKVEVKRELQGTKFKTQIHKVQLLDPATGTGTFLNETILHIKKTFAGQEGRWAKYVKEELLPRLHGFELMMAPYTIAHLKLSSTLKETGAEIGSGRLGIYLTNSLEKTEIRQRDLFSFGLGKAITEESEEANKVKNDLPIMVILGNPPYNVSSQNKGEWIGELIKDYKKNLGERKINLDDDYIKFIRFSQYLIEKNGEGIIGMITNNSYIDGITHRQMRKFLLEAFDDIYILDLHGNVKKKETAPDGSKDENVFDIQQGVAISIFVRRTNKKKGLGKVFHASLYGRRAEKYAALRSLSVNNTKWQKVDYKDPSYFFVPKNFSGEDEYKKGFSLTELFIEYNSGIQTKRDDTTIAFNKQTIEQTTNNFATMTADELTEKYNLPSDGRDWQVAWAKADLLKGFEIGQIQYRPFDIRWTAYTGRSKGFLAYPREKTNKHVFNKYNPCILTSRNFSGKVFDRIFTTKYISDIHAASDQTYVFPLYQYEQDGAKFPNFNKTIYKKIVVNFKQKVEPENILDYVYAVLYSPNYREKYQEFLKIDFPHIPYPKNEERLFTLAKLGNELRQLHLLEHPKLSNFITTYPETGNDTVDKVEFKDGKIYINKIQYFGSLPKEAWDFSVGGYLPAQKYLKDRKSRQLSAEEIEHYQKIITALVETRKIMGAIAALDL